MLSKCLATRLPLNPHSNLDKVDHILLEVCKKVIGFEGFKEIKREAYMSLRSQLSLVDTSFAKDPTEESPGNNCPERALWVLTGDG